MSCYLNRRAYVLVLIVIGMISICLAPLLARSPSRAPETESPLSVGNTISGFVRDANGPVVGAVVRVQTTARTVTTDLDGSFTLSVNRMGKGPFSLTAWARGYFSSGPVEAAAGQRNLEFHLTAHATEDNPDYHWLPAQCPPGQKADQQCCAACHSRVETDFYPFLPVDEWLFDAHSQSAVNPRFLSMYSGKAAYDDQRPSAHHGSSGLHKSSPAERGRTRAYGPGYKLDFPDSAGSCASCHVPAMAVAAPFGVDPTKISGVAAEGVTCDFCHKVWDVRLNPSTGLPFDNMPGVLSYEFRRPMEGQQFFAGPFDDVAPGLDTFSPLQRQGQFCAPCHYGRFGGTIIYNSFGEWLEGPYSGPSFDGAKTCQDCHMPTGRTCYFTVPNKGGRLRDPATIASHRMPGASDEKHLQSAASLQVTASRYDGHVGVEVRVKNQGAGHHLPTGSPLRHVILVVSVKTAKGHLLSLCSGPRLPQWTGDLSGYPGRVYAKVLEDLQTGASPTAAFWNPTRFLADTRLAAFETDVSRYTFVPGNGGPLSVEARLIFRRAFQELAKVKGWEIRDIIMAAATVSVEDEAP